jgi:hypothetical protein
MWEMEGGVPDDRRPRHTRSSSPVTASYGVLNLSDFRLWNDFSPTPSFKKTGKLTLIRPCQRLIYKTWAQGLLLASELKEAQQ